MAERGTAAAPEAGSARRLRLSFGPAPAPPAATSNSTSSEIFNQRWTRRPWSATSLPVRTPRTDGLGSPPSDAAEGFPSISYSSGAAVGGDIHHQQQLRFRLFKRPGSGGGAGEVVLGLRTRERRKLGNLLFLAFCGVCLLLGACKIWAGGRSSLPAADDLQVCIKWHMLANVSRSNISGFYSQMSEIHRTKQWLMLLNKAERKLAEQLLHRDERRRLCHRETAVADRCRGGAQEVPNLQQEERQGCRRCLRRHRHRARAASGR